MNMNNLMKQAQQMQAKLAMLQNELAEREVEAAAGGGLWPPRLEPAST
jgi:DNA-binding protein YbaB